MHYIASKKEFAMLKNHNKHLYCRLELLDKDLNVIDNLEGLTIDGSLSIDADSDIRHTFTSTIYLKQNEMISSYSVDEWIDKLVRVCIGIGLSDKNIFWYSKGIYAFNQNGFSYNATEHSVSVSCVDLVAMLDGSLSGTLTGYQTVISTGTKISNAIIDTYKLSGMKECVVNYWNRTVPYDIEFSSGTSIWSILTELRDLYYPFEMFFDDTTFVCQEIPSGFNDPVVLNDEEFQDLVISESCDIDYSEVKNCVEVFGASVEYDTYVDDEHMTVVHTNADSKIGEEEKTSITLRTTSLDTTKNCTVAITTPLLGFKKNVEITIVNSVTETDSNNNTSVKEYTHGPFKLYETDVDENGTDVLMDGTEIAHDMMIVILYSPTYKKFYYRGEQQTHAMTFLVNKMPTDDEIAKAKVDEACNNLKYICLTESDISAVNLNTQENPRFAIEKIGRRNQVCSGSEYEMYTTDESTMQCAEYMLWKCGRLTDSVTVECLLVPWLEVNQKISYVPHYIDTKGEPLEFIIKKISISLGEGTMTLTLSRYYPYYPYIVQNKY